MAETLDAKNIGLGEIEYDHSIDSRLIVGKMNLDINNSQEKIMLKIRKAARDAHILDQLKREKSEDQRTLSRIEKEYGLPEFAETDEDSWSIRIATLGTMLSNFVDNSRALQDEKEIEIRIHFIEKIAKLSNKREKEKLEKASPEAILNFANELSRKIMGVKEDAKPTEEDSKSIDK